MARYQCIACDFIYDEDLGLPDHGIPPGTKWEDIPDDWQCIECGMLKSGFILMEEILMEETVT